MTAETITLQDLADLAGDEDLILAGLQDGDLLDLETPGNRAAVFDRVQVSREAAGRFIATRWPAYIHDHPAAAWAFGPSQSLTARSIAHGDRFNEAFGDWFDRIRALGVPPEADRLTLRQFADLLRNEAAVLEGVRAGLLIDISDPDTRKTLLGGVRVNRSTVRCWYLRLFPGLPADSKLRKWADASGASPAPLSSISLFGDTQ